LLIILFFVILISIFVIQTSVQLWLLCIIVVTRMSFGEY